MDGFIFCKIIRKLECFHRRKVSVHLKQNRNGGGQGWGEVPYLKYLFVVCCMCLETKRKFIMVSKCFTVDFYMQF